VRRFLPSSSLSLPYLPVVPLITHELSSTTHSSKLHHCSPWQHTLGFSLISFHSSLTFWNDHHWKSAGSVWVEVQVVLIRSNHVRFWLPTCTESQIIGVVWGCYSHSSSPIMYPFDRAHATSYTFHSRAYWVTMSAQSTKAPRNQLNILVI